MRSQQGEHTDADWSFSALSRTLVRVQWTSEELERLREIQSAKAGRLGLKVDMFSPRDLPKTRAGHRINGRPPLERLQLGNKMVSAR